MLCPSTFHSHIALTESEGCITKSNIPNLKNEIDIFLIEDYLRHKGTSQEDVMKVTEKKKQEILQSHLDNVYPIKNIEKNGEVIGYYTKTNPKSRNHAGKISATTREDLEVKIIAYYLNLMQTDYTMDEILNFVYENYLKTDQKATGTRHVQRFDRYFSELANVKTKNLTKEQIEEQLTKIVQRKPEEKITSNEFKNAVSALYAISDYCEHFKIPCIDIRKVVKNYRKYYLKGKHLFKQVKKQHKDLSFSEQETTALIKEAFARPTYQSLFTGLILTTGCRAGELLCMSYDTIDLETNYFYVYETEDKDKSIKPYAKENESREVYLDKNARKLLRILLDLRKQDNNPSKYLFLNKNAEDGKLHLRAADDWLRKIQPKLGFDKTKEIRSLHDGRRTYASIAYLHGVDITLIQKQLGHSTANMTWEYIIEIITAKQRAEELEKGCLEI